MPPVELRTRGLRHILFPEYLVGARVRSKAIHSELHVGEQKARPAIMVRFLQDWTEALAGYSIVMPGRAVHRVSRGFSRKLCEINQLAARI